MAYTIRTARKEKMDGVGNVIKTGEKYLDRGFGSISKLKGCGKDVKTLWNFGSNIIVKCGFEEDGFKPVLCEKCLKNKED